MKNFYGRLAPELRMKEEQICFWTTENAAEHEAAKAEKAKQDGKEGKSSKEKPEKGSRRGSKHGSGKKDKAQDGTSTESPQPTAGTDGSV